MGVRLVVPKRALGVLPKTGREPAIEGEYLPAKRRAVVKATQSAPRGENRLTHKDCENAKPREKPYKLSDGRGMYLLVQPHGARLWRLKYRLGGREKAYALGVYPEVSLADARAELERARGLIRAGKDPVTERRVAKAQEGAQLDATFASISAEWLVRQKYSDDHRVAQRKRLDEELLPHIGKLPFAQVTPAIALETLRRIERRGALETAAKCRRMGSQIARYAIQTARAQSDPFQALRDAIKAPDVQHRATIGLDEMPALFEALAAVPAELVTRLAVYWLILTVARTSEMRFATWEEIAGGKTWRVPAERMKMRAPHVVPLATQAQKILELAKPLRQPGAGALLFPGFTRHGALSENAVLALLARGGFYGRQTGHGFRASFSTWAHEIVGANPDVIEACLAHRRGDVRATYNRALYVPQRTELLQAWADQCQAWGMKL
jgi:integrase